jgi:hypothetical protein
MAALTSQQYSYHKNQLKKTTDFGTVFGGFDSMAAVQLLFYLFPNCD